MNVFDAVKQSVTTRQAAEIYGVKVRRKNMAYKTVQKIIDNEEFGNRRIDKISVLDAKEWLIYLQDSGRNYSSIHTIRGVLRPAFQLAVESKFISQNPFDFEMKGVLINDSIKRESISVAEERRFLEFLKSDKIYSKIYDGSLILFNTGLRISELCGLTFKDIDMEKGIIYVNHQLQYINGKGKIIVNSAKTNQGARELPMNKEVYAAFERVLNERKNNKCNEIIDGVEGFLFTNRDGRVTPAYWWEKKFEYAIKKYNKIYKNELPKITPHICRHTYCTRMATSGISLLTLQKLMGHADIKTTINIYTHLGIDYVIEDVSKVEDLAKPLIEDMKQKNNIIYLDNYLY